jgi:hypothetical protein
MVVNSGRMSWLIDTSALFTRAPGLWALVRASHADAAAPHGPDPVSSAAKPGTRSTNSITAPGAPVTSRPANTGNILCRSESFYAFDCVRAHKATNSTSAAVSGHIRAGADVARRDQRPLLGITTSAIGTNSSAIGGSPKSISTDRALRVGHARQPRPRRLPALSPRFRSSPRWRVGNRRPAGTMGTPRHRAARHRRRSC